MLNWLDSLLARRLKYLEENAAAAMIKLSPEDMQLLEAAVPASKVLFSFFQLDPK